MPDGLKLKAIKRQSLKITEVNGSPSININKP